jgi:hypothetical protein
MNAVLPHIKSSEIDELKQELDKMGKAKFSIKSISYESYQDHDNENSLLIKVNISILKDFNPDLIDFSKLHSRIFEWFIPKTEGLYPYISFYF